MAEIRSTSKIVEKWARVTRARQQDFQEGVRAPRRDWADATAAAESTYEQGVQEAIARKSFGRGVSDAGTAKWKRKIEAVGVQRWAPGVAAAVEDFDRGFGPYAETIAATQLPPRFPAGDPRNFERVRVLGEALHAKKVGG